MNIQSLAIGTTLFFILHIVIWFQINGQFIWKWVADNPVLMAITGFPISYLLIISTRYMVDGFGGLLWPGRLVGFSLGMIVFAILTSVYMQEGLSIKTLISLTLATALVVVQILWK